MRLLLGLLCVTAHAEHPLVGNTKPYQTNDAPAHAMNTRHSKQQGVALFTHGS